ncbi:hypothetical protein EV13_1511 [Prochlorococcus sp. MIT 0702]|nr:hypothetical protein EV13_1511 [Prochlorococcus sp. MIT 0702]KGG29196.1 hypothetical protein EV12_0247 [Prochlorococcus sp. MIT 0701]KGG34493.1 hypothetical protein EV14_1175 [Prochlorococcus sp. MIT 0703]
MSSSLFLINKPLDHQHEYLMAPAAFEHSGQSPLTALKTIAR